MANSYKNRIFMDCGISHIQHIINGIARTRIHSSAIPRRAALSEEAQHMATIAVKVSPIRSRRSTKVSCDTCTFRRIRSIEAYLYIHCACNISGTFKCIFYFLQHDIKINSIVICSKSRERQ